MKRSEQAEFRIGELPEPRMAEYNRVKDEVIVDPEKLNDLVEEYVKMGKEFFPDLKEEDVWIAKFASLVAHEIIHRMLTQLFGKEVSHNFDRLHFAVFMEKIPPAACDMLLWSDALETNPIGDTWFS